MILSVFWLVAAVGWAGWQLWSGAGWRGSGVELGLLATLGVIILSAALAATYRHPAWLICWEWFVLLVAFWLVLQLARAPGDNRGLLAALLATGVTLSAYAVFQYTVEFPQAQSALVDRTRLRAELARENVFLDAEAVVVLPEDAAALLCSAPPAGFPAGLAWGPLILAKQPGAAEEDTRLARWQERIQAANVFATYAHPNSFAGFLALLFPAALGVASGAMLSRPRTPLRNTPSDQGRESMAPQRTLTILAIGCAVLIGLALWLTHSRGAILGVLVAGVVLAGVLAWPTLRTHKLCVGAGVLAVAGLGLWAWQSGWVGTAFGKDTGSGARRLEYWANTWAMIADHPWLGVGPGNFGRMYPRYMTPAAFEKLQDPHNFVLEMWATSGVFAALALLAALGALFWQVWVGAGRLESGMLSRHLASPAAPSETPAGPRKQGTPSTDDDEPPPAFHPGLRWEFYLGGVAGLLAGFVLRAGNLAPEFIPWEGVLAGGRSVVWFIAFAVLDNILWRGPTRALVLAAGILALLVNLLVSGGIALPSVALPLWVMAALSLSACGEQEKLAPNRGEGRWSGLVRFLPLPVLAVVWLAYLLFTFGPVTNAASAVNEARRHYLEWRDLQEPVWRHYFTRSEKPEVRHRYSLRANEFLESRILRHLQAAVREDPRNAAWWVELSHWQGERWKLFARNKELAVIAWQCADEACRLDPTGKQGYQAKYRLYRLFAQTLLDFGDAAAAPAEFARAAQALAEVIHCDPGDARLHYQRAELLFLVPEPVQARHAAVAALDLDSRAMHPSRRLTDRQRRQAERWLRQPSAK